jgi:hypothetical protein
MNGDVSIDVGSALPYVIERTLAIFGRDALTQEAKNRLQRQIRLSFETASFVQFVGMDRPIPIQQIYQQTRLLTRSEGHAAPTDYWELIKRGTDGIIFGGPGSGKTVLLHWIYMHLQRQPDTIPLLITLRWPSAVDELASLIEDLSRHSLLKGKQRVVLLIDGYDELTTKERILVSKHLREYAALSIGPFYLTCRLFYDVIDLKAPYLYVAGFSSVDALKFVEAFFKISGVSYDAGDLISELEMKGFEDFMTNPLLLTLICILKTGSLPTLPRNTIGVIRRAIDTLTLRWDESRGVARESTTPLDGDERIRCLMQVAYYLEQPVGAESAVMQIANRYLTKLQRGALEPSRVLRETAQWYGLFVPASNVEWTFIHRTIHDFLAARHWVESGAFAKGPVSRWNTRAAYAACLVPDATAYLQQALLKEREMHFLIECLSNNAPFDAEVVARALIKHFRRFRDFVYQKDAKSIRTGLKTDFLHLVSDEFLIEMVRTGTFDRTEVHDVIYLVSVAEWRRRAKGPIIRMRDDLSHLMIRVNGYMGEERFFLKEVS